MKHQKEASIYFHQPYGWRAGTRYIDPDASAVEVIRYEQEEVGNHLDVPDFLLDELAHKQVSKGYRVGLPDARTCPAL